MAGFIELLESASSPRCASEFRPLKSDVRPCQIENLFNFIWAHDAHNFDHPRYRLQTAFGILLLIYLGLHPKIILSEGFPYQDTEVVMTRQGDTAQYLLVICLRDRGKFPRGAQRWCGRTLVLSENPNNRQLCPVTLFLAMAIADGVVDGTLSAGSGVEQWPTWVKVPFKQDLLQLPVLRRAGNRQRIISSSAIKLSSYYDMIQAQFTRAGHEKLFTTMLREARSATQRENKYKKDVTPVILLGRGQGETLLMLLEPNIKAQSLLTKDTDVLYHEKSPFPLPRTVQIQIQYDDTRRSIISHLYGLDLAQARLVDIISPFIALASTTARELYYTKAEPTKEGSCPRCCTHLARIPMKTHLLKCHQKAINENAEELLREFLNDEPWHCKWDCCTSDPIYSLDEATTHISDHLGQGMQGCLWKACNYIAEDSRALHIHLHETHGTYTRATVPTRARFCLQCATWTLTDIEWISHQSLHLPSLIYGPVFADGLLVCPRRCPFCTHQGSDTQIDSHVHYVDHIEGHIQEQGSKEIRCPHNTCQSTKYSKQELRCHLESVHSIHLN